LIVTVFDAFSQLTGQLFGKTKLVPTISPNKTWEGLIGGLASAILISMLFSSLIALPILKTMALGLVISLFAFCGDLLASISKRKFGIKDFSNLLPGQGGFVDRFDSLIFASVIVLCFDYFNLI
jgi:phosphatidate cytidylyltransferase